MNRAEAREELITFIGTFECPSLEAVEMAIEALSEETVSRESYDHEFNLRKKFEMEVFELERKMAKQTDTAEVVRCKDCKHRYYADNRVPHERTWVCERFANEEITDNDFCSFGERNEE